MTSTILAETRTPDDPLGDMRGVFSRAGAMASQLREMDWGSTALGEPRGWPPSLRSAVGICLGAKYPIAIYWGADLTLVYNEAWSEIPGDKHPWALGRPGRDVWPDIWHIVGPELDAALAGEGMWASDRLLPMYRNGYVEETYFNYNLSPITGDDDEIVGVFNAGIETTARVLADRRNRLLIEVSTATANATGVVDACTSVADALESDSATVPFALLYLTGPGARAELVAAVPADLDPAHAPDDLRLDRRGGDPWRVADARRTRAPIVVDIPSEGTPALPAGDWPVAPSRAVSVPVIRGGITSRRPVLGVLVVGVPGGRPIDEPMFRFLELLAERLASAIANARVDEDERRAFETEHLIATTLQRSLIPELPDVAGLELRGRYIPGSADVEVGGDWYDAVALPNGQVALVIGDVMGKGVAAAAHMGQLKNAVRAYLLEGFGPGEVLQKLNRLTMSLSGAGFATVLCMFYDPASHEIRWCRAGHPPAIIRHADGSTAFLDGAGSPPLAVFNDAAFIESSAALREDDMVVLYTDGLVERREEGIDVGLERLAAVLGALPTQADPLDHLVDGLVGDAQRDDVAVLVMCKAS